MKLNKVKIIKLQDFQDEYYNEIIMVEEENYEALKREIMEVIDNHYNDDLNSNTIDDLRKVLLKHNAKFVDFSCVIEY